MEGRLASKNFSTALVLLLNLSSILLIMGAIFLVQIFSLLYGIANGIVIQSNLNSSAMSSSAQALVTQAPSLHDNILESYVLAVIAIILFAVAFLMFIRRHERAVGGTKRYATMHTAFVFVYALVYFIISLDSAQYLNEPYVYVIYAAIAISLVVDVFLDYVLRLQRDHTAKLKRTLAVDPSTPFSNMVEMQDKIFSRLGGNLKIVDKHFNSTALSNLHRLIGGNMEQFKSVVVITSNEMTDTNFGRNVADFRRELESKSVTFEVRFMDEADRIEQHERMMFDDSIAYKIPPFNIINKRSEHIIMINRSDAQQRFEYLYARAMSLENYSLKKGREQSGQA